MKKFLLMLMVMFSFSVSVSAQEFKQFSKTYNWFIMTSPDGTKTDWKETYLTVYYNYLDDARKMRFAFAKSIIDLKQIGGTTREKTTSGYGYQKLIMYNEDSDENVEVQLFDDESYGVRVWFQEGNSMQFAP